MAKTSFYPVTEEPEYTTVTGPVPTVADDGTDSPAKTSFYETTGELYEELESSDTTLAAMRVETALSTANSDAAIIARLAAELAETNAEAALAAFPGELHNLSFFIGGLLEDAETLRFDYTDTVTFPANMAGSKAGAEDASSASAVFSITKNGTPFATVTFSTSATGVFSGSETTFNAGDVLRVIAPSPRDATLAHVSISLRGSR